MFLTSPRISPISPTAFHFSTFRESSSFKAMPVPHGSSLEDSASCFFPVSSKHLARSLFCLNLFKAPFLAICFAFCNHFSFLKFHILLPMAFILYGLLAIIILDSAMSSLNIEAFCDCIYCSLHVYFVPSTTNSLE